MTSPSLQQPNDHESPLTSEQEERLADVLDALGGRENGGGFDSVQAAEREHPDLASHIRELWAAMCLTDAVAEQSAIFEREANGDETLPLAEVVPLPPAAKGSFVPGVSPLPATLGDYQLVAEIGRGGMGVVYKAIQKSLAFRRVFVRASSSFRGKPESSACESTVHEGSTFKSPPMQRRKRAS